MAHIHPEGDLIMKWITNSEQQILQSLDMTDHSVSLKIEEISAKLGALIIKILRDVMQTHWFLFITNSLLTAPTHLRWRWALKCFLLGSNPAVLSFTGFNKNGNIYLASRGMGHATGPSVAASSPSLDMLLQTLVGTRKAKVGRASALTKGKSDLTYISVHIWEEAAGSSQRSMQVFT